MIAHGSVRYAVVAFALMVLAQSGRAQVDQQPSSEPEKTSLSMVETVSVRPGRLTGTILNRVNRAPIGGQVITVSAGSDLIASVTTSAEGTYRLPPLVEGPYVMAIGSVRLPIQVEPGAGLTSLDILVRDRTPAIPAEPTGRADHPETTPEKTAEEAGETPPDALIKRQQETVPTWILITGGAVVTGGIVWAAVELADDDDDEDTTSPASSQISR